MWIIVFLLLAAGCAPEITRITPTQVRPDDVIVVEGRRMNETISVWVAGGAIPTSELEITQKKDKHGKFAFRMPTHDVDGNPLKPATHEATIRVGGTTKQVEIKITSETSPPPPSASQVTAALTAEGSGLLRMKGTQLRWPLRLRLEPIVPHGEEFGFTLNELRYDSTRMIDIPLPYGTLQLSSYRVTLQNSKRYGGQWSRPAVAVYKP